MSAARRSGGTTGPERDEDTRLDKWLWAARFYKTRSLASEAIAGGKVQVNGERAKRSRPVKVGDQVRLRQGPFEHVVTVRGVSSRRGPSAEAQKLYDETPESRAARERMAEQVRLMAIAPAYEGQGRPTKKDRRRLARFDHRGKL